MIYLQHERISVQDEELLADELYSSAHQSIALMIGVHPQDGGHDE